MRNAKTQRKEDKTFSSDQHQGKNGEYKENKGNSPLNNLEVDRINRKRWSRNEETRSKRLTTTLGKLKAVKATRAQTTFHGACGTHEADTWRVKLMTIPSG